MVIAHGEDRAPLLQQRAIRGAETGGDFGGELEVGEAGDGALLERRSPPALGVDEVRVDNRVVLDDLGGPDLDALLDPDLLAKDGVVRDHGALLDDRPGARLDARSEHRALDARALADQGLFPGDRAPELGARLDHRARAEHDVLEAHPSPDPATRADHDGAADLGAEIDSGAVLDPKGLAADLAQLARGRQP